jgi:hypothetical protein
VSPYSLGTYRIRYSSSSSITGIGYSGSWTLQSDGWYRSPSIPDTGGTEKERVSFTSSGSNASITIQLSVSSEATYDWAFISELDNGSATFQSGYYPGSVISGEQSVTITIPVPTAGSHFVDIGYRKDGSQHAGSDYAWFKIIP